MSVWTNGSQKRMSVSLELDLQVVRAVCCESWE